MGKLSDFEERVRTLTEDFRVLQWTILYHNCNDSSFFFRRQGGKKEILHSDYRNFFNTVFSIKQELSGTQEKAHFEGKLRNLIFSNSLSATQPITVLPISGERHWATIIAGDRNFISISDLNRLRTVEKKTLLKIAKVVGSFMEMKWQQTLTEINMHYQQGGKPNNFIDWLGKVMTGIQANEYHLYWIGEGQEWIHSYSGKRPSKESYENFKKNWIPNSGVEIWKQGEIFIHSNIRSKINLKTQEDFSLILTLMVPSGIAEKIIGHKDRGKNHYLAVQFVQKSSGKGFYDNEFLYAKKSISEGKAFLESQNLIDSLKTVLQGSKPSDLDIPNYQITLFQKNQLSLVVSQPLFKEGNKIMIKTDLKTGLNIGNTPAIFKYFQIKKEFLAEKDISIIKSGVDYFLSRSLDTMDYEKKIKDFFSKNFNSIPFNSYLFLNLDSPTLSKNTISEKKAKVTMISQGFHLLQYTFKNGNLKKLPNFGYSLTLQLEEEDIVLALPISIGISLKENLYKHIENELVVFGQSFPDKLVNSLGSLFQGYEFLIIKKSQFN